MCSFSQVPLRSGICYFLILTNFSLILSFYYVIPKHHSRSLFLVKLPYAKIWKMKDETPRHAPVPEPM